MDKVKKVARAIPDERDCRAGRHGGRGEQGMSGWQDISTAPKDGTWVLLKGGKSNDDAFGVWDDVFNPPAVVAKWIEDNTFVKQRWQFAWFDAGYFGEYENPTHWMPLSSVSETVKPNAGANGKGNALAWPYHGAKYRDTATGDEYEFGPDLQWRRIEA
mgnify:CR=1 FL=1